MNTAVDVAVLTDARWTNPNENDPYHANLYLEDRLVVEALQRKGLKVIRVAWDDKEVDWNTVSAVIFRSTWDYAERFDEFQAWRQALPESTRCINSRQILDWNSNKRYLTELEANGIPVPPTAFVEQGDAPSLASLCTEHGWTDAVIKPIVGAGGIDTFRLNSTEWDAFEAQWQNLCRKRAMMVQETQTNIVTEGEWSFMLMGETVTHAILKRAKTGEFRVQDDFGGTVHAWEMTPEQTAFAERVARVMDPVPVYTRVDAFTDNQGRLAVGELELIEPELWFRFCPEAADVLAEVVIERYF